MAHNSKSDVCEGIADMVAEHLAGDLPDMFDDAEWTSLDWGGEVVHTEGNDYFLVRVGQEYFRVSVSKAQKDTIRRAGL